MKLKTLLLLPCTEDTYKHLVHELCREVNFSNKAQPWLTKESYFIGISDGEQGYFQNSLLVLNREKIPSLDSQLIGEGRLVNPDLPQSLSLR